MLACLIAACLSATTTHVEATCYMKDGVASIEVGKIDEKGVAWAYWNDSIEEIGFNEIKIETNKNSSSADQMYCAGFVDGYLTQKRIYERFMLYKDINKIEREAEFPNSWTTWLRENINYVYNSVESNPNDSYWISMGLILKQFEGYAAGYNATAPENQSMDMLDLWIINSCGDIYDLEELWEPTAQHNELRYMECSGLVSMPPDYSDIYFGHSSWADFRKMTNFIKEYHFNVKEFIANRVVVSTKMGALPSSEDFWLTDRGLMIFETTNGNSNKTLFQEIKVDTILTWLRNLHAAWTTDSASEWATDFLLHNSGTYNNQYVIVDSKKFKPGEKPTKDLIWVTETMPGIAIKRDMTELFVEQGYWPSFNTPYFEEIFNIAGYPEQMKAHNETWDQYSYYNCSRYLIFKREAKKIQNYEDFKKVLRYNKYKTDEYGHNDPAQQILARYDLRPDDCKYGKRSAYGGLDTKTTTALTMLNNLEFDAIGSPQYEDNPVWEFGVGEWSNMKYDGLPKVWNFSWQKFHTSFSRCGVYTSRSECVKVSECGWCEASKSCLLGFDGQKPAVEKCESGWTKSDENNNDKTKMIIIITVVVVVAIAIVITVVVVVIRKRKAGQSGYEQLGSRNN
ncbi:Laminin A family protein [Histomonas meleagridis]|uniref:Laminin A family protein n=1 Tax=Histomonas meleagridis TaxID=135588 RepID=UPI00355964AA|nr:Laminin A family protein [Histomonas meleagridis]KAH0799503.1 Laminin A family protein [Histomonas meleagridis]